MSHRRVLIITTAFPPSTSAGTHRIVRFVRHLPEFGWTPCVLTKGTRDGLDEATAESLGLPRDLAVIRSQVWGSGAAPGNSRETTVRGDTNGSPTVHSNRGGHLRSLARNSRDLLTVTPDKHVWWSLASLRTARNLVRRFQPDVIFTSGPPHSTHLAGLALKRWSRIPWIADFRDPWARRPWGPKSTNPWGQRFLKNFERSCVKHADGVVLNTERMADEFRTHYASEQPSRFVAIPNGCDPRLIETVNHLLQDSSTKRAENSRSTVRLCHPGSLYRKRDPRPLLKAIAELQKSGIAIEFEQIGSCDPGFAVESCLGDWQLSGTVRFVPPLPHEECLERMAQADLFALIQPGTDLQVPGKLFEMMAFGKPLLALTDEGATADLVRRYGIGVIAAPTDPDAIAQVLAEALIRREELSEPHRWERARHEFDARKLTGSLATELGKAVPVCRPGRTNTQLPIGTAGFSDSRSH